MKWSELNRMQLGRYAEYYAKMEFTSYGADVYTSEVDDHGVDFIARDVNTGIFYEVQVKSLCKSNYVLISESKMEIKNNRLICFLHFIDDELPEVYVIPSTAWVETNEVTDKVLVHKKYDRPELKSKPEWGINYSKKNKPLLERYKAEAYLQKFINENDN